MRHTLLRDSIRRAFGYATDIARAAPGIPSLSVLTALGLLTSPAYAQDAPQDQSNQQLETITVTGSN
ncbi:MAG TPA: hypothetical protein VH375_10120, partial [Rhodanobacteraceae bacterium]